MRLLTLLLACLPAIAVAQPEPHQGRRAGRICLDGLFVCLTRVVVLLVRLEQHAQSHPGARIVRVLRQPGQVRLDGFAQQLRPRERSLFGCLLGGLHRLLAEDLCGVDPRDLRHQYRRVRCNPARHFQCVA